MKFLSVGAVNGPLYHKQYEDHMGDAYDVFVCAQAVDGNDYTLNVSFRVEDPRFNTVEVLVEKVRAAGELNLDHWELGTPWDHYKVPLTREEETARDLEFENDGRF